MSTFEELTKDFTEDDKKVVSSYLDSKVTAGIKSYEKNHPSGDQVYTDLVEKLNKLEAEGQARKATNDLRFYAYQKCVENGVPFEIISDSLVLFKDQASIDSKIKSLSELVIKTNLDKTKDYVFKNAPPPPGRGNDRPYISTDNLTYKDALVLEESNELDKLLKNK